MNSLSTVADYLGAVKVLYRGKDVHLLRKMDWWIEALGSTAPFLELTAERVDAAVSVLMQEPKLQFRRGQGVGLGTKTRAAGTVNKYIAALGQAYKLLKQHRYLPRSAVSPIVRGMLLPLDNAKTLQVSLADVTRLIASARLTRNRHLPALVAVACTTGLRKGNILGLTWADVDLTKRVLDVAKTKNGSAMRSVLLPWVAAEIVRIKPIQALPTDLVFCTGEFKKAFATALALAELPSTFTFHSCRHIAASILAQSGASLVEIMGVLNHKSPSMALRYSHLNTKSIEAAMNRAWQ